MTYFSCVAYFKAGTLSFTHTHIQARVCLCSCFYFHFWFNMAKETMSLIKNMEYNIHLLLQPPLLLLFTIIFSCVRVFVFFCNMPTQSCSLLVFYELLLKYFHMSMAYVCHTNTHKPTHVHFPH